MLFTALAVSLLLPIPADDPPAPREAICRRVSSAPVIDGKLDDPAWEEVAGHAIRHFPTFWEGPANNEGTTALLAWDDQGLYFAATMTDAELRSFGAKRNDPIWNGDVFELFFKPSADSPRYYEFQANPVSVLLDLPFPRRGHSFDALAALPPAGFQAVATIDGTLNHPGDPDRSWTVEGKIPWSYFAPSGGRPKPGDIWSFALCRYDYGPEGTEPRLMSSAPLTQRNFHRYEDYGKLRFMSGD